MTFLILTLIWAIGALGIAYVMTHTNDAEIRTIIDYRPSVVYLIATFWPVAIIVGLCLGDKQQ